jgi:hypothetical protein
LHDLPLSAHPQIREIHEKRAIVIRVAPMRQPDSCNVHCSGA